MTSSAIKHRLGRSLALTCTALLATLSPACMQDGQFTVAGYSTRPNYDAGIRTVRVPVFQNRTFRQGLEFDLTQEVVRQIEQKTPYKVVSGDNADTELCGIITLANKSILNRNQLNEIREGETLLAVELVWRDLRTGEILSQPRRDGQPPMNLQVPSLPAPGIPGGPGAEFLDGRLAPAGSLPLPPDGEVVGPPPPPPVVVVQTLATFVPELGESITTSYQMNVKRLATQVVSMMEKPW